MLDALARFQLEGCDITGRTTHFSLRTLLGSMSAMAVILTLVGMYGLPGIVLIAAILVALVMVFKSRLLPLRLLAILAVCGLMWCLCVHRVFEVYSCPICGFRVAQRKYEVFTIPVLVNEKHVPSMKSAIAEDFGCPCEHNHMASYLRNDDWGMIVRYPDDSRTYAPLESDEEGYNKYVRPITKRTLEERPNLAKEFCTRVLEQHDDAYWKFFYEKVLDIPEVDRAVRKEHGKDLK